MEKNKLLMGFLMVIVSLTLVYATTQMYGGETRTIYEHNETCTKVTIVVDAVKEIHSTSEGDREYNIIGCNLTSYSSSQDIWFCNCPQNANFTLTLSTFPNTINTYSFNMSFDVEDETPTGNGETTSVFVGGGGGGSGGACTTQWECTEWSACEDGFQTRTCSYPEGFCEPTQPRPAEIQSCVPEEDTELETEITTEVTGPGFFGRMTGAVIGALGDGNPGAWVFIVLIVLGGGTFLVMSIRKKRSK